MERNNIFEDILKMVDGKISNVKIIFEAIEHCFDNVVIIAVDKEEDILFYGFDYVDEQERLLNNG